MVNSLLDITSLYPKNFPNLGPSPRSCLDNRVSNTCDTSSKICTSSGYHLNQPSLLNTVYIIWFNEILVQAILPQTMPHAFNLKACHVIFFSCKSWRTYLYDCASRDTRNLNISSFRSTSLLLHTSNWRPFSTWLSQVATLHWCRKIIHFLLSPLKSVLRHDISLMIKTSPKIISFFSKILDPP